MHGYHRRIPAAHTCTLQLEVSSYSQSMSGCAHHRGLGLLLAMGKYPSTITLDPPSKDELRGIVQQNKTPAENPDFVSFVKSERVLYSEAEPLLWELNLVSPSGHTELNNQATLNSNSLSRLAKNPLSCSID